MDLPARLREEVLRATTEAQFSKGEATAVLCGSLGEAAVAGPDEGGVSWQAPADAREFTGEEIALGEQPAGSASSLDSILRQRVSDRRLGDLDLVDLSKVLVQTSRIRALGPVVAGAQESFRHHPSAGARHPNTIWLAALNVTGLQRGLYRLDPARCSLHRYAVKAQELSRVSALACSAAKCEGEPGVVAFVVTDFARTLSRYPAGSTLVWRDIGALVMLLHLAATERGLGSCIVGTCGVLRPEMNWRGVDTAAVLLGKKLADVPSSAE